MPIISQHHWPKHLVCQLLPQGKRSEDVPDSEDGSPAPSFNKANVPAGLLDAPLGEVVPEEATTEDEGMEELELPAGRECVVLCCPSEAALEITARKQQGETRWCHRPSKASVIACNARRRAV